MIAVLGFDKPTVIPCGRLEGHDGPHEKVFQWGVPSGVNPTPYEPPPAPEGEKP